MRRILLHIVILVALPAASYVEAQELLTPLSSAAKGVKAISPKTGETIRLEMPFFDDFSAAATHAPAYSRWMDAQAWVNTDYAPLPPTLGMVTLDAIDANGDLYAHASTSLFGADTLTSHIVRLDSLTSPVRRALALSDSIRLSFFYLPGGWYGNPWERVGDNPSEQDSLILEFFASDDSMWHQVWASPGFVVDTVGVHSRWPWRFASVPVADERYLSRDFRFRFRNLASLDPNPKAGISANCDQWNIDYIILDHDRRAADSTFRDIAFVHKAPSLLQRYQAMPARQYRETDMAQTLSMTMVNRYHQTLASTYHFHVNAMDGDFTQHYDGGYENIPAFFPNGVYQTNAMHAHPHVNFAFPASDEPATYVVTHTLSEGVSGDNCRSNDTTRFLQVFDNYYAYDDGFPENGYGLTMTGSKAWLAIRYDLHVADTLTAIDLFFNRTRSGENENVPFVFCVWDVDADGTPGQQVYKDNEVQYPRFDTVAGFYRYNLTQPVVVNGAIFVGLEQQSNAYINMGFDRSNNARNYTYYRTGNDWSSSILSGAVMLRPLFGARATAAICTPSVDKGVHLYPNPARTEVHIDYSAADAAACSMKLYDMQGRLVYKGPLQSTLHVADYPKGIYMLHIEDPANPQRLIHKLIVY